MRLSLVLISCLVSVISCDISAELYSKTKVSIEWIDDPTASIKSLAEIQYSPYALTAEITSYDPPDLAAKSKLIRIGIYDELSQRWNSSTSVTSIDSFTKGYIPTMILSLDSKGDVLGVSCRSSRIDAGQTRDFGPKVKVVKMSNAKSPDLNKPIVLSKEGKLETPEPEKTFLQKYWMIGLGIMVVLLLGGGGDK